MTQFLYFYDISLDFTIKNTWNVRAYNVVQAFMISRRNQNLTFMSRTTRSINVFSIRHTIHSLVHLKTHPATLLIRSSCIFSCLVTRSIKRATKVVSISFRIAIDTTSALTSRNVKIGFAIIEMMNRSISTYDKIKVKFYSKYKTNVQGKKDSKSFSYLNNFLP